MMTTPPPPTTPTQQADVIIVGAGLSGLMAAYTLQQDDDASSASNPRKIVILEARNRIGGRIHTVQGGLDLGPTWFWPRANPHVVQVVQALQLDSFEQYEKGQHVMERHRKLPVQRFGSGPSTPSMRFQGGTMALCRALEDQLHHSDTSSETSASRTTTQIRLNQVVTHIQHDKDQQLIQLHVTERNDDDTCRTDATTVWQASQVIVTLPPHLAATTIQYEPVLPDAVVRSQLATPTWMGQSFKVSLQYERPFWRQQDLSGLAVSAVGPVQQFHDASQPDENNVYGLFGWIMKDDVDDATLLTQPDRRKQAVLEQVTHLFGEAAAHPISYHELDWEDQIYTNNKNATVPIKKVGFDHPVYGQHRALQVPQWNERLWWASTEVSPVSGGFLDGAIYIGRYVARQVAQRLRK